MRSIKYIKASDSYDYGYKAGKKLKFLYLLFRILSKFVKNKKKLEERIEKEIFEMEKFCPQLLDELKGFSNALKIDLKELFFIHHSVFGTFKADYCTITLSTGKATKNNDTYLTQNWDIFTEKQNYLVQLLYLFISRWFSQKCWIVKINSTKYAYAFWGIPVLWEIIIINEKGLGYVGNGTRLTDDKRKKIDRGAGKSSYHLEKVSITTCKNVTEVSELWHKNIRSSGNKHCWPHIWDGATIAWGDKDNGLCLIEQSHSNFISISGRSTEITGKPEDILSHTNHHIWLDKEITGSVDFHEYPNSYERLERAYYLLEKNYGKIDFEVCKKITRDHGNKKSPICCHIFDKIILNTSSSWIILPKDFIVYKTWGTPCISSFKKYDFKKYFKKISYNLS